MIVWPRNTALYWTPYYGEWGVYREDGVDMGGQTFHVFTLLPARVITSCTLTGC